MNLPSRVGALVVLLSCVAAVPVGAEVPSGSPSAQATPPPAPLPTPSNLPASLSDTPEAAPAPVDPAKEVEIRKLLLATGTVKMVDMSLKKMVAAMRERAGDLPDAFWDKLIKEMDSSKLVEKLIPIYAKYYTLEDLKAVNAFYATPAGEHMLAAQPQIMNDSMSIGQAWGREAGMKAMLEIENYKKSMAPASPPASSAPSAPSTPASP